jgi:hypothetical protein
MLNVFTIAQPDVSIACTLETIIPLYDVRIKINLSSLGRSYYLNWRGNTPGITVFDHIRLTFVPLHKLELFSYWFRQLCNDYWHTNGRITYGRWEVSAQTIKRSGSCIHHGAKHPNVIYHYNGNEYANHDILLVFIAISMINDESQIW